MIRLADVELTSAEQAVQHYIESGLQPILVHAPTEVTEKEEAACTCGQIHKASGKHPIAKAWQKPVPFDELQNQLARLKYQPNIGIVLGSQPRGGGYIVAIDVDSEERFQFLQEKLGKLPDTVRSESGRGYHLFYELPPEIPIEQLKNVTGLSVGDETGSVPGVDVKAERGQVVVAPSIHLSGRRYKWTRTGQVAVLPMAWAMEIAPTPEAPAWSSGYTPQSIREDGKARRRAEKYLEQAVVRDCAMLAAVREGSRNDTLYKRAVRLFTLCASMHLGAHWSYVDQQLHNAAIASGLPETEIKKSIASAEKFVRESGRLRMPVALLTPAQTKPTAPTPTVPGEAPAVGTPAATTSAPQSSTPSDGAAVSAATVLLPSFGDPLDRIRLTIDKGTPAKTAGNVAIMLSMHPAWRGGPSVDSYSQTELWPNPIPEPIRAIHRMEREIVDADHAAVQAWLMEQPDSHRVRCGRDDVSAGIHLAASRSTVDLLREWVDEIPDWDGATRIDSWTVDYLGVADSPYARATGRAWLMGAMERVYRPGVVLDVIPVLEGLQRSGKNLSLETLFHGGPSWAPWLVNISGAELDTDESKRIACARWVMHDDELRASDPKRVDALKSWASRTRETYRLQYRREITVAPRRAALIASTNRDLYLHDETGNRRWLPWATGKIRIDLLSQDRLQLLAEARDAVRGSLAFPRTTTRPVWQDALTEDVYREALTVAEQRRISDPLVEQIHRLITAPTTKLEKLTTTTIAAALGFGIEKVDRALETRVGAAMRELEYVTKRGVGPDGKSRVREYVRPPTPKQ